MKNMAYWKGKNSTPAKQMVANPNQLDPNSKLDPSANIQQKIDAKIDEKVEEVVNNKTNEGLV